MAGVLDQQGEDTYDYEARPIKVLARDPLHRLGIYRSLDGQRGGLIAPIDRKELKEWQVSSEHSGGAQSGELVRFEALKRARYGLPQARITQKLGNPLDQKQVSLIAIHRHAIPNEFPQKVLDELAQLSEPDLGAREDLRAIPLITIDPPDARDHDDAVHAAPDDDPANKGGHIVIVAIADVAHYVRPASALDAEALKRGNSVYFPDRVVPMLPERISNELCSLREKEERPCLAVRMVFDARGIKRSHKFVRAMMRSAAKLSYGEAQDAIDGRPGEKAAALLEPVLHPLWRAYEAVRQAREKRQPLDLELPERKILLDDLGRVKDIVIPPRLDAHKLIEEFMIQANVCAAQTLEKHRIPLIYRSHDAPASLAQKLKTQGARSGNGFNQTHLDPIAKPVGFAAALANQRMAFLVMIKIFRADAGGGNEAVGTGICQTHKHARAGDTGNAALKMGADPIGQMKGDQPVGGFAFRGHCASFKIGDIFRRLVDSLDLIVGQRAVTKLECPDQGAVNIKVGIAAYGTGEMGVAAQVEAEMSSIARRVNRLALAAQDYRIHQFIIVAALDLCQDFIELRACHIAGARQIDFQGGKKLRQGGELSRRPSLKSSKRSAPAVAMASTRRTST